MGTVRTGVLIRTVVAGMAAVLLMGTADVHAQEPAISVEEAKLLRADDATKTLSAKLSVAGVAGNSIIAVVVAGGEDGDCVPTSQPVVRPGAAQDVSFKFPADCDISGDVQVEFVATPLDPSDDTTAAETVTVAVADAPSKDADYSTLAWYLPAAVFSTFVIWFGRKRSPDPSWDSTDGKPFGPVLPGLTDKWKFGDSWAANVTLAAAVFTGLFGTTDVLKSILGKDHEAQVAVAVVAAALTTGLVGAAPIVLDLLRRGIPRQDTIPDAGTKLPTNYTAGGLLAASWLVLTANLGIVWTMVSTLESSESISWGWMVAGAVGTSALITAYTVRSMRRTLREGVIEPSVDDEVTDDTDSSSTTTGLRLFARTSSTAAMP